MALTVASRLGEGDDLTVALEWEEEPALCSSVVIRRARLARGSSILPRRPGPRRGALGLEKESPVSRRRLGSRRGAAVLSDGSPFSTKPPRSIRGLLVRIRRLPVRSGASPFNPAPPRSTRRLLVRPSASSFDPAPPRSIRRLLVRSGASSFDPAPPRSNPAPPRSTRRLRLERVSSSHDVPGLRHVLRLPDLAKDLGHRLVEGLRNHVPGRQLDEGARERDVVHDRDAVLLGSALDLLGELPFPARDDDRSLVASFSS